MCKLIQLRARSIFSDDRSANSTESSMQSSRFSSSSCIKFSNPPGRWWIPLPSGCKTFSEDNSDIASGIPLSDSGQ
ncbi:hypothetical protein SUGI_0255080 [Cryptomeria japonica]|nr:hypothetical protein SUGI_0255080 [Cryptomeria japonica]